MSSEELLQLLGEAISLPPEQRPAFLDRACKDQAGLRAELERLLDADDQVQKDAFMNTPAIPTLSLTGSATPSASPTVFAPGQKIADRYRIVRFVGVGGMGQVYQAKDEVLDDFVALKTIRPEIAADEGTVDRFKKEVKLAHEVADENVCRVFDLDHRNQPPFLTMEFIDGETLSAALRRFAQEESRMSATEALSLIEQMAHGLHAAHQKGVIHGDFKPGNVMLTQTDSGEVRAKVMDFGLAHSVGGNNTLMSGKVAGTPGYMAPELLAGGRATVASDIYALGLIIFEMVTGAQPVFDRSREPAPSPRTVTPSLDTKWEIAIFECLERDPAKRPFTALEVVNLIRGEKRLDGWVRRHPRVRWVVGLLLLLFGIGYWAARNSVPGDEMTYSQVTTDSGLSTYPVMSRDGKLMAYASDRSGERNLDIWLRQTSGGEPSRLTWNPAEDYDPSFSADVTKIAFRSERDGGGIYVVPTLGGKEQLLVRGGFGPRFSPDGNWIAYWVGLPGSGFVPGSSQVYVKPTNGGPAKALATGLVATFWPIWAPDSKRLLVVGKPNTPEESSVSVDWWVVPLGGGPPMKTFALSAFKAQHLAVPSGQDNIVPIDWFGGNHVLFSAISGDATNLWEATLSKARRVISTRRRTVTTSLDLYASVATEPDGLLRRMVFASLQGSMNVWSMPIDANRGRVTGALDKLTQGNSDASIPSISADGTKLVFVTGRSNQRSVRMQDIPRGNETTVTTTDQRWLWPRISPKGDVIAYVDDTDQMFLVNLLTNTTEKVGVNCGPPTDISPGGDKILFEQLRAPNHVMMIDVPRARTAPLIRTERSDLLLFAGRFSPDTRWVVFTASLDKSPHKKVFVSPIRDGHGLPEAEWIPVTDGLQVDQNAAWSPDGNLLYFLSERDGRRCIWAQRLKPATKRPVGSAFAVLHLHDSRQSLARVPRFGLIGMTAAEGRLVFAMSELRGDIWMEERKTAGADWLRNWLPPISR